MPDTGLYTKTVTIASGASSSEKFQLHGEMSIVGFVIPAWTTANIKIKTSFADLPEATTPPSYTVPNDSTFQFAYDDAGNPIIAVITASTNVKLSDYVPGRWFQLFSVDQTTHTTAVNQGSERSITVLYRKA